MFSRRNKGTVGTGSEGKKGKWKENFSIIYIGKCYSVFEKRERKYSADEKEKGQAIQVQAT
jgi:hypothetical protein